MHVAAEPIQFADDNRAFAMAARGFERGGELRATVEGVRALAGLDLGERGGDFEALGGGEAGDRLALGVEPEAGFSLFFGAYAIISDKRRHGRGAPKAVHRLMLSHPLEVCHD